MTPWFIELSSATDCRSIVLNTLSSDPLIYRTIIRVWLITGFLRELYLRRRIYKHSTLMCSKRRWCWFGRFSQDSNPFFIIFWVWINFKLFFLLIFLWMTSETSFTVPLILFQLNRISTKGSRIRIRGGGGKKSSQFRIHVWHPVQSSDIYL